MIETATNTERPMARLCEVLIELAEQEGNPCKVQLMLMNGTQIGGILKRGEASTGTFDIATVGEASKESGIRPGRYEMTISFDPALLVSITRVKEPSRLAVA